MPTIGEHLKATRETRKLTLKQAVQVTHVRLHYLKAMETDDFTSMPSPAQARGFLRLYADYLGLNADDLISSLRSESQVEEASPAPVGLPVSNETHGNVLDTRQPVELPAPEPPMPDPLPVVEPGPVPNFQSIFNEIGFSLRNRRELISITLDEVERHTRVRKYNLELIEAGKFEDLPSPVQARGILNTYATFLDMDNDAVLLRYADALQSRRIEHQPDDVDKSSRYRPRFILPFWLRRFISPDLVFGGGMVAILLALTIWGAARILSGGTQAQTSPTQGPSISDVLLASTAVNQNGKETIPAIVGELGTFFPTLDPALIVPSETLLPKISSAVQVTIVVFERTFLRVTVDGEIKQDGRVSPGAAMTFDGNKRIEVLTGSGAATQIIFNQSNLGVMGNFGEVVNRIYTINGVETPTPTSSPTPSITPRPSSTPKPTLTLRPSSTLRPTSTPRPTSTTSP